MSGAPPLDDQVQVDQQDARVAAAVRAGWVIRRDADRLEFTAAREMLTARTLDELLDAIEASGVPGGHAVTPKRGTAVSLRTGLPADLTDMRSYPVAAECTECGGRVVCEQSLSLTADGGWRHEEQPT